MDAFSYKYVAQMFDRQDIPYTTEQMDGGFIIHTDVTVFGRTVNVRIDCDTKIGDLFNIIALMATKPLI